MSPKQTDPMKKEQERGRTEVRDGREFVVIQLPEAKPPKNRSAKSRFHFAEVDRPGSDVSDENRPMPSRKRKRKRKR